MSVNANRDKLMQSLRGYVEACGDAYELVPNLPVVRVRRRQRNKTALVIGGSRCWMSMLMLMLGDNLADAVICGTDPSALDPNSIMRAGLSVNNGEGGILYICSDNEQEKQNFLYADGLLDEADIRSKVVFSRNVSTVPEENAEIYLTGNELLAVKIAGAACSRGESLEQTYEITREARNGCYGIKTRLDTGRSTLKANVDRILYTLLSETHTRKGDAVCLCMSGFGSLDYATLCAISSLLRQGMQERGVRVHDIVLSPVTEEGEGAGVGVTLMAVNERLIEYYDLPCSARFFRR